MDDEGAARRRADPRRSSASLQEIASRHVRLRLTIETRPWLPLRALAVDFPSGGVCSAEGDDRVWRRGKLDVLTRSGRLWDSIPADTRRRRARVFLRQVQDDADTMALVAFLAKYGLRPWDAPSEWGLRNT